MIKRKELVYAGSVGIAAAIPLPLIYGFASLAFFLSPLIGGFLMAGKLKGKGRLWSGTRLLFLTALTYGVGISANPYLNSPEFKASNSEITRSQAKKAEIVSKTLYQLTPEEIKKLPPLEQGKLFKQEMDACIASYKAEEGLFKTPPDNCILKAAVAISPKPKHPQGVPCTGVPSCLQPSVVPSYSNGKMYWSCVENATYSTRWSPCEALKESVEDGAASSSYHSGHSFN